MSSRDAQAGFEDGLHGSRGGRVVVAEDGVRPRVEREQVARGLIAGRVVLAWTT